MPLILDLDTNQFDSNWLRGLRLLEENTEKSRAEAKQMEDEKLEEVDINELTNKTI